MTDEVILVEFNVKGVNCETYEVKNYITRTYFNDINEFFDLLESDKFEKFLKKKGFVE